MCRVLGSVAAEPTSLRHELLEAANPLIRPAGSDDGWGMASYPRAEGEDPQCRRFPTAAASTAGANGAHGDAADMRARLHNVHVRKATIGDCVPENTHPFCLGPYSFSHNGTVRNIAQLSDPSLGKTIGTTDSEHLFRLVMHHLDSSDPVAGLRYAMQATIERYPFTSLSFLFSDGERLYAYRLGHCELHWLSRPGQLIVASEELTEDERWHSVRQDVLLVLDPRDSEEPHAERLVGDDFLTRADIRADELAVATSTE